MDIGTMYTLLAVAAGLFIITLWSYITSNINIITLSCTMLSAVLFWKLGNAYIDGTLTKYVGETSAIEVVREPVASVVFHWIAIVVFIAFVVQIITIFKDSKVIEE